MTGNKYLLDTNILSAFFKGERTVNDKIIANQNILIPVIVIGELSFGAQLSNNPAKYLDDIKRVRKIFDILPVSSSTCFYYGAIKAALRKKGTPIPENDIWISAIAIQNNVTLVTRDGHFNEVEGLMTERW